MKPLHFNFAILLALISSSFTLPGIEKASPETAPPAQVDYFLKLDGVDGESTSDKHRGWIEITSGNFNQEGRTLEIERTQTPIASRALQNLFSTREYVKKAVLHIRKSGDTYLEYKLENVLVTSYQHSGSGADMPTEQVTFVFSKVTGGR